MKIRAIFGSVLVVIATLSSIFLVPAANATPLEPDWFSGEPVIKAADKPYSTEQCTHEVRKIATNLLNFYKAEDYHAKNWCVYHYKGFDITFYKRSFSNVALDTSDVLDLYPNEESGMAIAFDDGVLTPVDNIDYGLSSAISYVADTDRPIFATNCKAIGCEIRFYDFRAHIPKVVVSGTGYYHYDAQPAEEWCLRYMNGEVVLTDGFNVSNNGRWASFSVRYIGLARLDMSSLEWVIVDTGNYSVPSWFGGYMARTAITDDGMTIAYVGSTTDPRVIRYSSGCGITVSSRLDENNSYRVNLSTSCRFRSLMAQLYPLMRVPSGYLSDIDYLQVDASGGRLLMRTYDVNKWYTMYPSNALIDSRMTYLALGDSFSSGEGDIISSNINHYIPGTNVWGNYKDGIPRELCHISDRSYPFLLAADMNVSRGEDMQSIACSGAVRNDVSSSDSSAYMGQNTPMFDNLKGSTSMPRLDGLSNADLLQQEALSNVLPGRVRQIELLKASKPQVATITISGNDLGFGGILSSCITEVSDCYYVTAEGKKQLGEVIHGNYEKQVELFTQLKQASPGTDLYAVGYPKFISDTSMFCWQIADTLSQPERQMINEAVSYVNATIRQAALKAGIKYIDIEDSLLSAGGELCGKNDMITDPIDRARAGVLTQLLYTFEDGSTVKTAQTPIQDYIYEMTNQAYRQSSESLYMNPNTALTVYMQQAFHPNAQAHQAMYNYIHERQVGTSLLDDECDGALIVCPGQAEDVSPNIPSYFGSTANNKAEFRNVIWLWSTPDGSYLPVMDGASVERSAQVFVNLNAGSLAPMTDYTVSAHSEPITLVGGVVSNDGSIVADITIPDDIPIGYHTFTVSGQSSDGLTVNYLETLFITGSYGDVDGDGVGDSVDTCEFIAPSGIDKDRDGIDDGCDLQITQGVVPSTLNSTAQSRGSGVIDTRSSNSLIAADWSRAASGSYNLLPVGNQHPELQVSAQDGRHNTEGGQNYILPAYVIAIGISAAIFIFWRIMKKSN